MTRSEHRPWRQLFLAGPGPALVLAAAVSLLAVAARAAEAEPWRLAARSTLPSWLQLEGSQRSRYETLARQFRTDAQGSDQMLALRTTLRAEAAAEHFGVVAELMDSRQALADSGSPTSVLISSVNAAEWLQHHVFLRVDRRAEGGSRHELRLGRQTTNLGSRRLMARNEFRNTANSFTGLYYQNDNSDNRTLRAFALRPLRTEPRLQPALLDNDHEGDAASATLQFWGLHLQQPLAGLGASGELYLLGLHEDDSAAAPSRNRRLLTPGARVLRRPADASWDFDVELALQYGQQRATAAATDLRDLDHRAWFLHLELGHTLDLPWRPRAALLFDHASGDSNPLDGDSNRFDTLFGARRWEHGPSGIMGAFLRNNISSPGASLLLHPQADVDVLLGYRPYWLAAARDVWTASGLHDPSGRSGSFVAQQLELRLGWTPSRDNLRVELGAAWLEAGEFMRKAPNRSGQGDTSYGYLQLEFSF